MKKYTLFIIALLLFAGTWALAFCQSPKNEAQVVTVRTVAPGWWRASVIRQRYSRATKWMLAFMVCVMCGIWNLILKWKNVMVSGLFWRPLLIVTN